MWDCAELAASMTIRQRRVAAGGEAWDALAAEGRDAVAREPMMMRTVEHALLAHDSFADALAHRLAHKLEDADLGAACLAPLLMEAMEDCPDIAATAAEDLATIRERDPSCTDLLTPFLYFKGYQAIQAHRVAHHLWRHGRQHAARFLQSRASEVFGVDIHPAARLGRRLMFDHGTGIVIGETATVDDDVSMLHAVTLGGTGKEGGERHPKVRRGVLIGAGAKILGNIEIGEGAKIGAGSIVLHAVEPYTTVVGNPAKPVGMRNTSLPALTMDQMLGADCSG
ncbi:MAG: serine O-acetyltransferase [Acetobacteraceae bacterium]|nr:serine O-acetyltransferase [Acetobacteraceae bacterium]